MQVSWSWVLNIVFLTIIFAMMFSRYGQRFRQKKPISSERMDSHRMVESQDEILAVRQIVVENQNLDEALEEGPSLGIELAEQPENEVNKKTLMIFVVAQGPSVFAGYELLQTLLTCGLRFGEGGLFHRHQHASGQGPILFSLAAATPSGMFDLQNMGAMTMKGLCLFMELSGNNAIDQERYDLFLHTAKQLAQELQANLLDGQQRPLTAAAIAVMQASVNQESALV